MEKKGNKLQGINEDGKIHTSETYGQWEKILQTELTMGFNH